MAETTTPKSNTYRMADRLLDGQLAERIAALRAQDLGFEDISRRLYEEAGIDVSHVTLRGWARRLGIEAA